MKQSLNREKKLFLTLFLSLLLCSLFAGTKKNYKLWYNKPATKWSSEALPLGNGALGCMVYGGVNRENIQFNENTLWIGDENRTGAYQNFGNIYIDFNSDKKETLYKRELNISKAVHTITYTQNGVRYKREYFISYPSKVMVLHFTADKPNAYDNVKISLKDAHKAISKIEQKNSIAIKGNLKDYIFKDDKGIGYKFYLDYKAKLKVITKNGKITTNNDGTITVSETNNFTILLAAATNFTNDRSKNWRKKLPEKEMDILLNTASIKTFPALKNEHIKDYRKLFDRFDIDLGKTNDQIRNQPLDKRLHNYKSGKKDPELEELICQVGRYYVISASRCGLPSNLQGIWNNSNTPPWRCDFHSDVNLQMNYWLVDQSNLSDCFQPLADWMMSIREVRKKETYNTFKKRGWIMHAENGPFGGSTWQWSKGDSAWLLQCLWSHYQFTLDKKYLEKFAYPLMKDVCEFWVDDLKKLPDGKLVSPNGYSPEHGPREDGVSFDQQLIWNLFGNFIKASNTLGIKNDFTAKIAEMQKHLLGPKIGKWGQLQEWMKDRDDPKDKHRHLSHMIAIHPSHQISPITTPELAKAAAVSMVARGDASTGWSKAWKINIWARLQNGNHAYKLINEFIKNNLYSNLFGYHPPFQMDCNFGYVSGVCEMLLQSHSGFIQLLPALPDVWKSGSVKGIKARNAFILDIEWKDGELKEATIFSEKGAPCRIYSKDELKITCKGKKIALKKEKENIFSFQTKKGAVYKITPKNK